MKLLSVGLSLLVLFHVVQCGFVETIYTATLTNDQEVPVPNDAAPTYGTAVCNLNRFRIPVSLTCEIQHNVLAPTGANIHSAKRGVAGQIVYSFTGTIGNHILQSFIMEDKTEYSVENQIEDFLSGIWYISIKSENYPSGEIRGQIEHTDRFYSILNTGNTVPRAGGSATGIAVGTYSFVSPKREMAISLIHNVHDALTAGLEIREGPPGRNGPLIYSFRDPESPVFQEFGVTINEKTTFFKDLQYLNLASQNTPTGEIRGQIVTIDYIDTVAFSVRMDGDSSVPEVDTTARGAGLFAYDCDTKVMEYIVLHNVDSPLGSVIGSGGSGDNGTPLFSLSSDSSPAYGAVQLNSQEEFLLYTGNMYVSIGSSSNSQGEIRGQIGFEEEWWAYLSGTNVVPPVTTPAVGIATMRLEGDEFRRVDYSIFHSISSPQRVTFNVAKEGENGPVQHILGSVFSPIRGDDIVLDDDDLDAFINDESYFVITSENSPLLGEIRGQIKRLNPCKTKNDNELTVGENSSSSPSTGLPSSYYLSTVILDSSSDSNTLLPNITLSMFVLVLCSFFIM